MVAGELVEIRGGGGTAAPHSEECIVGIFRMKGLAGNAMNGLLHDKCMHVCPGSQADA